MCEQNKRPPATDEYFMRQALQQAAHAAVAGEVPVGAVVVFQGRVIAKGRNRVEEKKDASLHAEIIALGKAAHQLGNWRLDECDLYVSLEPCAMCAGAMVWSRIRRVIYGAGDPKAGACGSVLRVIPNRRLNHRPELTRNILADESRKLLKTFFLNLRRHKRPAV